MYVFQIQRILDIVSCFIILYIWLMICSYFCVSSNIKWNSHLENSDRYWHYYFDLNIGMLQLLYTTDTFNFMYSLMLNLTESSELAICIQFLSTDLYYESFHLLSNLVLGPLENSGSPISISVQYYLDTSQELVNRKKVFDARMPLEPHWEIKLYNLIRKTERVAKNVRKIL